MDLETGAVVSATLQPADRADARSIAETVEQADDNLVGVMADEAACENLSEHLLREAVTDKGYHTVTFYQIPISPSAAHVALTCAERSGLRPARFSSRKPFTYLNIAERAP